MTTVSRVPTSGSVSRFPPPSTASPEGIVAMGGDLRVETLLDAYAHGIFPWPHEGFPLLWFSPPRRGIFELDKVHVPRSLKKSVRRLQSEGVHFTRSHDFKEVVEGCRSTPRKDQTGTWITEELAEGYSRLFDSGFAYSIEAWRGSGLVGGVFGVRMGRLVTAESMFHRERDVSKVCLLELFADLRQVGLEWLDIQMVTSVSRSLGALEVSRDEFLARLP